MCNIAGYIGKKQAAPILCEMMKRQEYYWGGYYTGITTHDGSTLHTTKVIGNMENFLNETDGIKFPGTTGFLHSRSKGGGGVEWGHPFTNRDGSVSYIANGGFAGFDSEELFKARSNLATELEQKGYLFRSKIKENMKGYPNLSGGGAVHCSDLQCQHIASLIDEGLSPAEAMSRSNREYPSSIVGVMMHQSSPDKIFVTRLTCPLVIGITDDNDTYLATTKEAFPEDVCFKLIELLPPATTFEVFAGGFKATEYPVINNILPLTPSLWHNAYIKVEKLLTGRKENPATIQEIWDACNELKKDGFILQTDCMVYGVLGALKQDGKLIKVTVPDSGAFEGYSTYRFNFYIN